MIEVAIEPLDDHPVVELDATQTYPEYGIHADEAIAYYCLDCHQLDEDVAEIVHQPGCELSGLCRPTAYEHGEAAATTPEFQREHPLAELVAAHNHGSTIPEGTTLGWACLECLCSDETATEIVHEGDCSLAGASEPSAYADRRTGPLDRVDAETVATDGSGDEE